MQTVVIVIHLMVIIALIAVVLLQRSEGGALGIGGSNSIMSGRGQGNVLTRATTILGIVFFATSIAMSILARLDAPPSSILELAPDSATAPAGVDGADPVQPGGITMEDIEALTGVTREPAAETGAETEGGSSQVPTSQ